MQTRSIALLLLTAAAFHSKAQGQCTNNYGLSSLQPDQKVPITTDPSGIVQGIYANTAKDKTVTTTTNCYVGPVGAGIFLAKPEQPLPSSACTFMLRRVNKTPALVVLPVSCSAEDVWYDATVIPDAKVLTAEGKLVTWGLAKPKSGAVKSIRVSSKSMKEQKTLATLKDGGITNGRMSLADLGEVELLFIAQLGSAMSYVITTPSQLRKLTSLLSPADVAELLRTINE